RSLELSVVVVGAVVVCAALIPENASAAKSRDIKCRRMYGPPNLLIHAGGLNNSGQGKFCIRTLLLCIGHKILRRATLAWALCLQNLCPRLCSHAKHLITGLASNSQRNSDFQINIEECAQDADHTVGDRNSDAGRRIAEMAA